MSLCEASDDVSLALNWCLTETAAVHYFMTVSYDECLCMSDDQSLLLKVTCSSCIVLSD